ncbi:RNA polymerase sigma factor [Sphingomonas colocasiae]|uniref:RNA polymerase sigma factor n=1 Tax=Sphingomonas colocasiae TaxID=1848973 RepID=A0ABS7PJR8_9SPHN|nr:RNA polymerase sigma factor [Sphingomonas colocasiae]MBY8821224.1 RNA polymerase sigma factor [Sphingomonas colocasiae]
MVDDDVLEDWFCREVLPLERSLTHFIRRNWRVEDDVTDLRHDVYELAISAGRGGLPANTRQYLFTIARNHLINRAKRARIVSFDLVADLETIDREVDLFEAERHLNARESLRRVHEGLERLSPRVREIVRLRKVEGLNVQETAERLGIGKDAVNHQVMMGMKALADFMLGGSGKVIRPKFGRRHRKGGEA